MNELEFYDGCYYGGNPFYYEPLKWGQTYELRDLVSMVRLVHDPYNYAYKLSKNEKDFYNFLALNKKQKTLKVFFFLVSLLFISQFFIYVQIIITFENLIILHELKNVIF